MCSTNQMLPEVKLCKAEIRKGKNENILRRQYAELKSGRNNELEEEMCVQSEWDRNPPYKQYCYDNSGKVSIYMSHLQLAGETFGDIFGSVLFMTMPR